MLNYYKKIQFAYNKNIEIPEEIDLETIDGITKKNLIEYLTFQDHIAEDFLLFQEEVLVLSENNLVLL